MYIEERLELLDKKMDKVLNQLERAIDPGYTAIGFQEIAELLNLKETYIKQNWRRLRDRGYPICLSGGKIFSFKEELQCFMRSKLIQ